MGIPKSQRKGTDMKVFEILKEASPDQQAVAKLKQDAKQLKAMSDAGNIDVNKALPMMQNMATTAAKADMGSKLLVFFQKMAGAIKKGIDTNQYSAKDLPTMQKAYDEIMAQMPALKKIAVDSRRLAVQHGGAGRQDVGEDMNAIVAKQGKKKHGQKYMDAARQMAQEKGRKLTPDERDKLRDKHSDNRKQANETTSGSIGSVAQNMTPGKMISRNMYNSNGTMKNGLDYGNILGGPSQPKKAKKRRV